MKSISATSLASKLGKTFEVTDVNSRMLKQAAKRGEDEHGKFEVEIASFSSNDSLVLQLLSKLVYYGLTIGLLLFALLLCKVFG